MMKRKGRMILAVMVLSLGLALPAGAETPAAELPDFPIMLNEVEMPDMAYTKYPLLVYKDITYFPMTWYNCRMLGLETEWSDAKGLAIWQNDALTSSIGYYPQDKANAQTVAVSVPDFGVTVNGQVIDNSKEQYPLLKFRDVTYFPLTWRFAHDAFGWDYTYTAEQGLRITSHNPQTIYFPALEGRDLQTPIRLLDEGCYYYLKRTWQPQKEQDVYQICRAPVDNSFRMQVLHTFEAKPYQVDYVLLDDQPYALYQMQKGETFQALKLSADGSSPAAKLDLTRYTNGSSTGDRQNGYQYALREGKLCRSEDGKRWQVYGQKSAAWFGLLNGQVYYLHKTDKGVGELYKASSSGQDQLLLEENVRAATIQDGYLLCMLEHAEDYGAKLLNAQGELVLAITGPVDMISVSEGIVMASTYAEEGMEYLKVIRL